MTDLKGVPSLGDVVAALNAAEIQECHVNGDKADVISAPPGSNFLAEHRLIARCATGPLWIKQAVAIAKALNFVRALAAAPPSEALAQALAAARAETDWRDISTAPRNLRRIILAVRGRDDDTVIVRMGFFDPEDRDGVWWWAGESRGDYNAPGGRLSDGEIGAIIGWMPLPVPPTPAQTDTAPGGRADG